MVLCLQPVSLELRYFLTDTCLFRLLREIQTDITERYLVMKNKMIKQYLIHFPEVKTQFAEYTRIVNEIIDNLHHYYYSVIERSISSEMPFVYKPLAFQIQSIFLNIRKRQQEKL